MVAINDHLVTQIRKPEPTWAGPRYSAWTLRSLHDWLITAFFILGYNIVHDNDHQMAYPLLQLLDLLFDGRYDLIALTFSRISLTSHTSTIFSAIPVASCSNGTGIRAAVNFNNNIRACFRWSWYILSLKQPLGGGEGVSNNFWTCVRE